MHPVKSLHELKINTKSISGKINRQGLVTAYIGQKKAKYTIPEGTIGTGRSKYLTCIGTK